jgi:dephospho-CoA kinase
VPTPPRRRTRQPRRPNRPRARLPDPIPFVGLTGGIGAGKSTALAALERQGAATLSTDAVVHQLYEEPDVLDAVVDRFGDAVAPAGSVDRGAVARSAFATPEDRKWLEELLWPRVGARMHDWRSSLPERTPPPKAAVVEVPLLFEAGMDSAFDATIAVIAPEELRAERAGDRGHQALDERHARQLTQEEKSHRATYTVVNDGDIEILEAKLAEVLDMLNR